MVRHSQTSCSQLQVNFHLEGHENSWTLGSQTSHLKHFFAYLTCFLNSWSMSNLIEA